MDSIRLVPANSVIPQAACSCCGVIAEEGWDRIAGKAYCIDCMETLALGEIGSIREPVEKRPCAICRYCGTVRYLTHPRNAPQPIEVDLCADHLRSLIARRLGPAAFACLRNQLSSLGLNVQDVFLLHDAFYDADGRALQPISI